MLFHRLREAKRSASISTPPVRNHVLPAERVVRKPPYKGAMGLPSVHLSSRVGFALLSSRTLLACECIRAPSLQSTLPCSGNILGPKNAALRNCACDRTSGETIPAHGRAFVFLTAIGGGLAVGVMWIHRVCGLLCGMVRGTA